METVRRRMIRLLEENQCTARDLSQSLGITEKQVYDHLAHVGRSVKSENKKLRMTPARCLGCGFVFENRSRLTKPGRCPSCKDGPISPPAYRVE